MTSLTGLIPIEQSPKRRYLCQRCLNHGLSSMRRNHKNICPYKNCLCKDCKMVVLRNEYNSEINRFKDDQINRIDEEEEEIDVTGMDESTISPSLASTASKEADGMSGTDEDEEENMDMYLNSVEGEPGKLDAKGYVHDRMPIKRQSKGRDPCCQKCHIHKKKVALKNHKKRCPYKSCLCEGCKLVDNRRGLMAQQIKLRRKQKRDKEKETRGVETCDVEAVLLEARRLQQMTAVHSHVPVLPFVQVPAYPNLLDRSPIPPQDARQLAPFLGGGGATGLHGIQECNQNHNPCLGCMKNQHLWSLLCQQSSPLAFPLPQVPLQPMHVQIPVQHMHLPVVPLFCSHGSMPVNSAHSQRA